MNRDKLLGFRNWLTQQVDAAEREVEGLHYNRELRNLAWCRYCVLKRVLRAFTEGVKEDEQAETD